jgi:glyoxylase-like metal-dependent hydrolase (beta-lactamase superfamily II)
MRGNVGLVAGVVLTYVRVLSAQGSAERVIGEALAKLGGAERIAAIRSITLHGRGTEWRSAQLQGPSPDRPTATPREEWLTVDLAGQRTAIEYDAPRHDGSVRWRRFAYGPSDRTVVDLVNRFASTRPDQNAARVRADYARRVPHLLLLEASRSPERLRDLGDSTIDGARYRLIGYRPADHETELTLWLDPSERLAAVSYSIPYAGMPIAAVRVTYDGSREDDRLRQVPRGHTTSLNGQPFQRIRYDEVLVDDPRSAARFAIPDDIAAQTARPGSVLEVAPGVHVIHALAGFTSMFVEFRDFVLAVEAPATGYVEFDEVPADGLPPPDSVASAIVAAIGRAAPGKPIRYVTVSHFHGDHAGGVPTFARLGATLVTTPGTEPYFRRLLGGSDARIETVARRRVISDGHREVVIVNGGRTPHTDEALIVYLPKERILYQGDQFYFQGDDTFPAQDRLIPMKQFARWLLASTLPVERIYGTHMIGYATMRHVRRVMEAARPLIR